MIGGKPRALTSVHAFLVGVAWTPDSQQIVFESNHTGLVNLWRVRVAGGDPEPIPVGTDYGMSPTVSLRQNRLAFVRSASDTNLWKAGIGPAGAKTVRIVASTREDSAPSFSPDGRRIAFASDRSGSYEIYVCGADGSNQVQLTSMRAPDTGSPRWSPDGTQIAFDSRREGHSDVSLINADGGTPRRLTTDAYDSETPNWSHDSQWIYFTSERSGAYQSWKLPARGGSAVQVTESGGLWPAEAWDGKSLYYFRNGAVWMRDLLNGVETRVLNTSPPGDEWRLCGKDICFLDRVSPTSGNFVRYDPATKSRRVTPLDLGPLIGPSLGMDVSADGSWVIYSRADSVQSDIMLVENFH